MAPIAEGMPDLESGGLNRLPNRRYLSGTDGTRTHNLRFAGPVLSQLSYCPIDKNLIALNSYPITVFNVLQLPLTAFWIPAVQ